MQVLYVMLYPTFPVFHIESVLPWLHSIIHEFYNNFSCHFLGMPEGNEGVVLAGRQFSRRSSFVPFAIYEFN